MKPYAKQDVAFRLTSVFTDRFPRAGAKLLDSVLLPVMGNSWLRWYSIYRNRRRFGKARDLRKFIVLPDIHIGDAVLLQSAVSALRDFFPDAQIDYAVKKTAAGLIAGNSDISNLIPLFTGATVPLESDLRDLSALLYSRNYDVCFNSNPFLISGPIFPPGLAVVHFRDRTPFLVWNEFHPVVPNHFVFQSRHFIREILAASCEPRRSAPFRGVPVSLTESAAAEAEDFLKANGLPDGRPILFFNPDTASRFTRLPFPRQQELLGRLAELPLPILIGAGHDEKNIGVRLRDGLPPERRGEVRIVPTTLSLEGYAALIDSAAAFISGDTGPLHIAAARKTSTSGSRAFRNRTSIYCLFGATPAGMSGYDSFRRGFFPANQDAPSHTYVASSPCRNISCVNKMFKTCAKTRCFESIDLEAVVSDIRAELPGTIDTARKRTLYFQRQWGERAPKEKTAPPRTS